MQSYGLSLLAIAGVQIMPLAFVVFNTIRLCTSGIYET